ncbi:MAG: hypothetical protein AAGF28_11750 [Pseudomonadota bacterium]
MNSTGLWKRALIPLGLYALLLIGGHLGGDWLINHINADISSTQSAAAQGVVVLFVGLYALFLAVPFVPGVEISIALLVTFGAHVAMIVYLGTVAGLMVAFLVGRLMDVRAITRLFRLFNLTKAAELIGRLAPLDSRQRLDALMEHAPQRFIPFFLRHRYISIVVLFNTPGNFIIGGGGGIALMAGVSGLFSIPKFLLATAIAVMPVPLAVLLWF